MTRIVMCELCGNNFHCSPEGKCWCSGHSISRDKRISLSLVADDCICPNCLERHSR